MSSTAADRYHARFHRALHYIDSHLDEALDSDALSEVAAFSKFHFHRQFTALFGVTVGKYIQLRRLKRAAYQLAYRNASVLDVALTSGYEGSEAFSRAFKKVVGQPPAEFRKQPNWAPWHASYEPMRTLRNTHMPAAFQMTDVHVVDFKPTRVAVLEHRGDPRSLGESIRRFIEWRKQHRLPPSQSATFNVLYDDPTSVDPTSYRFDLCAATEREIAPNDFGVREGLIPGGRCATLRLVGSDDRLESAARSLYSSWLPQSGEEPSDFPLFLQRVKFFPDVAEHEAILDLFLPLR